MPRKSAPTRLEALTTALAELTTSDLLWGIAAFSAKESLSQHRFCVLILALAQRFPLLTRKFRLENDDERLRFQPLKNLLDQLFSGNLKFVEQREGPPKPIFVFQAGQQRRFKETLMEDPVAKLHKSGLEYLAAIFDEREVLAPPLP